MAKDSFFQEPHFKEQIGDLLPLDGIVFTGINIPASMYIGDRAMVEISALHHADCSLALSPQGYQTFIQPIKILRTLEFIDNFVHKSNLTIQWIARDIGRIPNSKIEITCGNSNVEMLIPEVTIVGSSRSNTTIDNGSPMFWFPIQYTLSEERIKDSILLETRENRLRKDFGYVNFPATKPSGFHNE